MASDDSVVEMENTRYRMVLLGSGKSGKSCVLMRFLTGAYSEKYKQTVEDLHNKEYDYNGCLLKVDFLDTAGNFAFPAMRRLSISNAHAFLLVFAIDDAGSFLEVQQIWEQIKEQRENYQDIPLIVVANKIDLESNRQIKQENIDNWVCQEDLFTKFVEISAKKDDGVNTVFKLLWHQVKSNLLPDPPPVRITRKRRTSSVGLSVKEGHEGDGSPSKFTRSKSLMRKGSKGKVKPGTQVSKIDCTIS